MGCLQRLDLCEAMIYWDQVGPISSLISVKFITWTGHSHTLPTVTRSEMFTRSQDQTPGSKRLLLKTR